MLSNLTFSQSTSNIILRQGTDSALQILLKDSTNTPIDLTGATVKFVAKLNYTATTNLISLSSPNDITISGNQIIINFNNSCVKGYLKDKTTTGVYQIELVYPNGSKTAILDGTLTIIKDLVS